MSHRPGSQSDQLTLRKAAVRVVRQLQDAGYDAFFAGGCVRDMLMGKRPHDYDVATAATPEQVVGLFRRTQRVGAQFGVVLVRVGRFPVEVATFRKDIDYRDGRHPSGIRFTNAREDARRRDFTINGMFHDPLGRRIVDFVDGRKDLEAGIIRAIGDPKKRFAEDYLRILRAIRFAARLGFTIHRTTWSAMCAEAPSIRGISPERIRDELERMLTDRNRATAFDYLCSSGMLEHLFQGADELRSFAAHAQKLLAVLPSEAGFDLALAVLLHGLPTSSVGKACDALRCSNQTKRVAKWLIAKQDAMMRPDDLTLADLKRLMVAPAFDDLLRFHAAKLKAAGRRTTPYRRILARVVAIPPEDVAPPPLFDGHDLAKLGLPAGPLYKTILDKVYYAQLNGDVATRAAARNLARALVEKHSR